MGQISQKELAKALGLSTCTISKALRNDPGISEPTRKLVKEKAAKLGYQPNPVLSAIASRRFRKGTNDRPEGLAFVNRSPYADADEPAIQAARETAQELGYTLEVFRKSDWPDTAYLNRVLWARGIRGVILGSIHGPHELEGLRFERYSLIKCGLSRTVEPWRNPPISVVRNSLHLDVQRVLREAIARGFRRILPVVIPESSSLHEIGVIAGACASFSILHKGSGVLMPRVFEQTEVSDIIAEIKDVQPDLVVAPMLSTLYQIGCRANGSLPIPFALWGVSPENEDEWWRGIPRLVTPFRQMGAESVRQLDRMIRQGQFGLEHRRLEIITEGQPVWDSLGWTDPFQHKSRSDGSAPQK